MTLREFLERPQVAKMPPERAAKAFFKQAKEDEVLAIIEREVIHVRRASAREAQMAGLVRLAATSPTWKPKTLATHSADVKEILRAFGGSLDSAVRIGDGKERRVREMTRAEHVHKVNSLRMQARSLDTAAEFHQRCADLLAATGARTLGELERASGSGKQRAAA